MELLGYTAAAVILSVFLLFFHDVLYDEAEDGGGLSIDLPVAAIFLVVHATVAALTSPVFAFVGATVVFVVMLRPVRFLRRRVEAAGFDTTRRTMNAPLSEEPPVPDDEPVDVGSITPVEVREPVTAGGGGLSADENAVWEDLTSRLDD